MRRGEDLGRWVTSVRHGWDQLTTVQQWMCEQVLGKVLGVDPASEDEKPKARTSQADKWAMHYTAAAQYFGRADISFFSWPGSRRRLSASPRPSGRRGRARGRAGTPAPGCPGVPR